MTGRAVPEWVGSSPDTAVPPRVKLRVWDAHGGRCHIAKRKIMATEPWDLDHVIALINWSGEGHGNRESNLAPALRDKHRQKTAADAAEKSAVYIARAKHLGIKKPGGFRKGPTYRGIDGQVKERRK